MRSKTGRGTVVAGCSGWTPDLKRISARKMLPMPATQAWSISTCGWEMVWGYACAKEEMGGPSCPPRTHARTQARERAIHNITHAATHLADGLGGGLHLGPEPLLVCVLPQRVRPQGGVLGLLLLVVGV